MEEGGNREVLAPDSGGDEPPEVGIALVVDEPVEEAAVEVEVVEEGELALGPSEVEEEGAGGGVGVEEEAQQVGRGGGGGVEEGLEEGPALVVDEVDSIGHGDNTRRGGGDGREGAKVGAQIWSSDVARHSSSPTNDGQWTTPPTTTTERIGCSYFLLL